MFEQNTPAFDPLPKSHYFLTVSRGAGMRTFALRAWIVHLSALTLPVLALGGIGVALYFMFHDELVTSLMTRQSQMQYAYEDRIDGLKGELDRQARRQLVDQASVERKMRDLVSRELRLETRAEVVAGLATQAGLPRDTAALAPTSSTGGMAHAIAAQNPLFRDQNAAAELPGGLLGYAPLGAAPTPQQAAGKPHPEADLGDPAASTPTPSAQLSLPGEGHYAIPTRLSLLSASLDRVEQIQAGSVARIGAAAHSEAVRLRGVLEQTGLAPERFRTAAAPGVGGPFVPLPEDKDTPFGRAVSNLQDTVGATALLRNAVNRTPLAGPLAGPPEVTSPFGARIDPFLGRPALHPGVDLKEGYGADVRATAAGRVVSAGPAGGYGNMVEIDHGNGLTTRYAHLSDIGVSPGQMVAKGGVLGQVGATGRATGPHLHYEVRIDGEPVDPMRFLNAGMTLVSADAH